MVTEFPQRMLIESGQNHRPSGRQSLNAQILVVHAEAAGNSSL
jgi:hypothetical protein